jgi:hypothetical protein
MINKKIFCILLFSLAINVSAANLIIVEGSYQGSCADKKTILTNARNNAYSKLPGNKQEYEQVSSLQSQEYDVSDNCGSYVSASFVNKAEDIDERTIQTMGRYIYDDTIPPKPNEQPKDVWDLALKDAFQKAKLYCNSDQDPQFLKITNKKCYSRGFGLFIYEVYVDYNC